MRSYTKEQEDSMKQDELERRFLDHKKSAGLLSEAVYRLGNIVDEAPLFSGERDNLSADLNRLKEFKDREGDLMKTTQWRMMS